MKKIIFISLLIIVISKLNKVEYAKEISFDQNNNEFTIKFPEDGALFIYVSFGAKDILRLILFFKGYEYQIQVTPPGEAMVIPFTKDFVNKIILEYKSASDKKGTIWMNPSTNEIKVDLNQIYEWKYDFMWNFIKYVYLFSNSPLIYSIDNAEKDVVLEFKYNNNYKIGYYQNVPNPMQICQEKRCNVASSTYEIKKGESYKIIFKLYSYWSGSGSKNPFAYYYLPSFKFHFITNDEKKKEEEIKEEEEKEKEKEKKEKPEKKEEKEEKSQQNEKSPESNKYIIYFIILGIILIGGIVLAIILICKKKKKESNYTKANNELKLYELYNI